MMDIPGEHSMIAITEPSVYGSADTKKVYHFIEMSMVLISWIVVSLFPVKQLGICLKKIQTFLFLFLKTQKIDKGTRIYQVNCTVFF